MAVVLVAEANMAVRDSLASALHSAAHVVRKVGSAKDLVANMSEAAVDLVILDLELPDLPGVAALRVVRKLSDVPIIAMSTMRDQQGTATVLAAGASECVSKPVSTATLADQVTSTLQRSRTETHSGLLTVGGLQIDCGARTATLDGAALDLARREFDLLAFLAQRAGSIVTRQELFKWVWRRYPTDDKTLDVHICFVRRKLGETARDPKYVHTIRSVGFTMPISPCAT